MSKVVFIKTNVSFPHGTSRADMIARFQGLDIWTGKDIPATYSLDIDKADHVLSGKKVKLITKLGRRKVLLTARVDRGMHRCEQTGEERTWCRWQVNVE